MSLLAVRRTRSWEQVVQFVPATACPEERDAEAFDALRHCVRGFTVEKLDKALLPPREYDARRWGRALNALDSGHVEGSFSVVHARDAQSGLEVLLAKFKVGASYSAKTLYDVALCFVRARV